MAPSPTHDRESYTVGIICALDVEKASVEATLDEEHGGIEKMAGDDNSYSFGRISDLRLGDVVVSQLDGMHGRVVQWDFVKMEKEGVSRRTGTLNKPPQPLQNALQGLKATHRRRGSVVHQHLKEMMSKYPLMEEEYGSPGSKQDELFEASYSHPSGATCAQDDKPRIHYGNIASGDEVVKDGPTKDRIAREERVLRFEIEAAGLMDAFPCVVIRGVCDYADSHKNKRWQPYAAAKAVCYAEELLGEVDAQGVERLGLASE
ncbi:hypothetical protein LTR22_024648 [Elasticomyces elasticus]|nr:hypothetical protein LTR22_024648 [Elasticomyces elasticus]